MDSFWLCKYFKSLGNLFQTLVNKKRQYAGDQYYAVVITLSGKNQYKWHESVESRTRNTFKAG